MLKNILINLVVAAVTGSVVFGVTMASVVSQVKANTIDIGYLKQADQQQRDNIDADRKDFTARMAAISSLIEKQVQASQELITMIKMQQTQKVN